MAVLWQGIRSLLTDCVAEPYKHAVAQRAIADKIEGYPVGMEDGVGKMRMQQKFGGEGCLFS